MSINPSVVMKKPLILLACAIITIVSKAQIGIGTTTPNTTLDVRGSLAVNSRSFSTTSESVTITDYSLLFTGTSACTLTLPDATLFPGRLIHIKNTKTGTVPVLTIATTSSQTIDGSTTWLLDDPNESVNVVSDGSNWRIMGQSLPSGSGTSWTQGGNTVSSIKKLGTIDNYDLPFITNNTEKMRLTNAGSLVIGNTTAPDDEILYVDGGDANSPNNLVTLTGDVNGYLQLNIQNKNNSNFASSDIVATANNGNSDPNDNTYYIDFGINSLGYTTGNSNILNGSNSAYLYSNATEFYIGNGAPNYPLIFFTNGAGGGYGNNTANGTERMRITPAGNIAIGTTTASDKLTVAGNIVPSANNSYDLGTSLKRWSTVYSQNVLNTSDARLKTNIGNLNYGLSTIMKMRSVQYNWKEGVDKETKIGFLAQDLRKIIPEVVVGDESKENLAVNYIELIPVLVNAIKEQQQQIEELKKKVKALENK